MLVPCLIIRSFTSFFPVPRIRITSFERVTCPSSTTSLSYISEQTDFWSMSTELLTECVYTTGKQFLCLQNTARWNIYNAFPLKEKCIWNMHSRTLSDSKYFIVQLMHSIIWIVRLLIHTKNVKYAPTCFGSRRNHHQGAKVGV